MNKGNMEFQDENVDHGTRANQGHGQKLARMFAHLEGHGHGQGSHEAIERSQMRFMFLRNGGGGV